MSKVLGVIPSRYGAQRFPGKPLAPVLNRPLLSWVIDGVKESKSLNEICLATDHQDIESLGLKSGISVAMTASDLPSGTDRVWAAAQNKGAHWVVNIQGDEPLINGTVIDHLIREMKKNPEVRFFTMARPLDSKALQSPNTAKVILNHKSEAIYFSRLPIPFTRKPFFDEQTSVLKHIGIYGFRSDFLKEFCEAGPCELESLEGLEQLRSLYMGEPLMVVNTDYESWGVDTPSDVSLVEDLLRKKKSL